MTADAAGRPFPALIHINVARDHRWLTFDLEIHDRIVVFSWHVCQLLRSTAARMNVTLHTLQQLEAHLWAQRANLSGGTNEVGANGFTQL